ncbi:uncharacterized protein LOC117297666 [Asterias rubens]|uniref:uncharacterized protein LOC117297666 n=1 Tax=Asterias rubens TaxID=7604 RepID=UPI001455AD3B|nr:uncharacterized protein LOC117297666 [Asterias rubens]
MIFISGKVYGQGTTPETPNRVILPPPPPPPPNPPQDFQRDDDTKVTEPPITKNPQEPIDALIKTGGKELTVSIEFKSFDAAKQEMFQTTMSTTCNAYCKTNGNCEGDFKVVDENDVIVYNISAPKAERTTVSFYIKNPDARTMLTMTTEQIDKMVVQERASLEIDLGYKIDLGDLDGFVPFTNGLLLESWVITLLAVIGLCLLFGAFVACVHFRNKKRDTKLSFDDLELQASSAPVKVLPEGPPTGANSLKTIMVDSSTNVYQADILAETKSVFIKDKPSGKKDVENAENEKQYAVIDDKHEQSKQETMDDLPGSPNAIVVTAEITSSSSNDSGSEGEPPSPSNITKPPDYEEVAKDGETVNKPPTTGAVDEDNLPPPPSPEDASPAAASEDLPPPPSEQETKDHVYETSLESTMKEEAEVVGELENLIADQSKNESAKQGLDNSGFETVVGDDGEPSTVL